MKLLQQTTPTTNSGGKLLELEKKISVLKTQVDQHQKDLKIAAASIEKMATMLSDISAVQKIHVEQTANLQLELDSLLAVLFPKDEIKFDLLNDTYN